VPEVAAPRRVEEPGAEIGLCLKLTRAVRITIWYSQLLVRNTESRDTVLDQKATVTNGQELP